jgi:anti-sigma regulatory factor (Ser/Thr protein kinase)
VAEGWQGIRATIYSDVKFLEPIRTLVGEATALVGLEESEATEVLLAVQEACANVIRHCYKDCPDQRIDLGLSFEAEALVITIDDYGVFVDPSKMKGRKLEDVRPGGLGIHLMRKVMDEVRYEPNRWGGTTLTLVKRIPPASTEEGE